MYNSKLDLSATEGFGCEIAETTANHYESDQYTPQSVNGPVPISRERSGIGN